MTSRTDEKVLVLITFKLKEGVTREQWLDALEPALAWSATEPGYVGTDLFYDPEADLWIDLDYWATTDLAGAHLEKAPQADANTAMFALIDGETAQLQIAEPTDSAIPAPGPAGRGTFLELIRFKLKDGVSSEEWAAALEPALRWVERQPGFVSVDMFHAADTATHVDVNLFESRETSAVHSEKVVKDPENAAMFRLIDDGSVHMNFAEHVISSTAKAQV